MATPAGTVGRLVDKVPRSESLCPEQIISPPRTTTTAVLIDQWGRAHRLLQQTIVGREPGSSNLTVLESSISRRHAELRLDEATDRWQLRDLGSTNGTFLDGKPVTGTVELPAESVVRFGEISFGFAPDLPMPARPRDSLIRKTLRPQGPGPAALPFTLLEPTGGGGGIAQIKDLSVQLTHPQFSFLQLLADRMMAELDQPEEVRGFVRSVELTTDLPWDTPHPQDNHVKQLVRRVRRTFERAGLQDVIESRHRFGYRLRLPPQ